MTERQPIQLILFPPAAPGARRRALLGLLLCLAGFALFIYVADSYSHWSPAEVAEYNRLSAGMR